MWYELLNVMQRETRGNVDLFLISPAYRNLKILIFRTAKFYFNIRKFRETKICNRTKHKARTSTQP